MKVILLIIASAGALLAKVTDEFIASAKGEHGGFGEKAAGYLVEHMPVADREALDAAFLMENLSLALKARETFPWAGEVPEEVFFNDVLPYAVFDEPRDSWRAEFLELATPIVKNAKTASEAAQALNKQFFDTIRGHYDTGRKRTNQSPKESIDQGKATCTGLSIILVDVCRAVGIPARAVGTPMWTNGRGNHTWVEIYDRGRWLFTGADEYTAEGLNRGWFTGDAAKADASQRDHAIYATSWKRDGLAFPMVWAPRDTSVGAVNVTRRYMAKPANGDQLGVRLFAGAGRGSRVAAKGWLVDSGGRRVAEFASKAGKSDLNDMPRLKVTPGRPYRLRFDIDGSLHQSAVFKATAGESVRDVRVDELAPVEVADEGALTREQAEAATRSTFRELVAEQKVARTRELEGKRITRGEHTLRWLEKTFGDAPPDGRSLWISMHGGGGAQTRVNDRQWKNQIRLYQPKEGIYVAPRAPTDTWNLWHQGHIDLLFSRLIEDMVAIRGVNPDKVYLMGYSAGGDGVWQLAPRMADRFAAASMMAGHPNESSLLGLRNLPFGIFMGGADSAYKRNEVAAKKTADIRALMNADKGGYIHMSRIYEGMPHWMGLKDAESLPWMAGFSRRTWPKKIVWYQDDVTHNRFYWLQIPDGTAKEGQKTVATVEGRRITLEGFVPKGTRLLLHDALLDLDAPVEVAVNGRGVKTHEVKRRSEVIHSTLEGRLDPNGTPSAVLELE